MASLLLPRPNALPTNGVIAYEMPKTKNMKKYKSNVKSFMIQIRNQPDEEQKVKDLMQKKMQFGQTVRNKNIKN